MEKAKEKQPGHYEILGYDNKVLGLMAIGSAAGMILAIYQKRGILAFFGFGILGSALGRGIGLVVSPTPKNTEDKKDGSVEKG